MALREGNRQQMQLLPPSIEQYISEDAPVRVYDLFVDTLDLAAMGINIEPLKEGNPCYDPRTMLKLLVYGYSYGVRSSRKLERETYYNLSFIWIMGGLKPDHKTIAEFRRKHQGAVQQALVQCVRLCVKLDLIAGNILFVDGSKIRGNAAIKHSWTKEKGQKVIEKAEKRIEEVLREAEALDAEEEGQPSLVSMPTQLAEPRSLQQQVEGIMEELKASGKKNLNTVDRECTTINGIHGTGAGYTAEVVVDDSHGLIVSADAVSANNDLGQFSIQINQAQEVLGKVTEIAVADSGFADTQDLEKIDKQGIQVIVPSQRLANTHPIGEFDKGNFKYDQANDCYICPQGEKLSHHRPVSREESIEYTIGNKEICLHCQQYGQCTTNKTGRKIMRLLAEEVRERLEQEYVLPENQTIYKRRQAKVELVFGHFKRNLGVSSFLMRGIEGARAEIGLLSMCFNVRRMITLLGQKGLINKLKEVRLSQYASFFDLNRLLITTFSEKDKYDLGVLDIYLAFITI
jgi:transposase